MRQRQIIAKPLSDADTNVEKRFCKTFSSSHSASITFRPKSPQRASSRYQILPFCSRNGTPSAIGYEPASASQFLPRSEISQTPTGESLFINPSRTRVFRHHCAVFLQRAVRGSERRGSLS